MRRSAFTSLLLAGLLLPATASAVQTVISDGAVTHDMGVGATVSIGVAGAPADFTMPDDYAVGTIYHRVIVAAGPTNAMTYQVCFVQGANRACSANNIAIAGAGTFEANQPMTGLSNYAMIDWTMPLDDIEVVAMDSVGVPVDAGSMGWIGEPDFALYYPLNLTYQLVIVANGDAFEGYPGMMMGNPAEPPAISPNGGTFEGSIAVTLDTPQMDGMIYYTTDGTDPDDTSTLYDGTAITIDTPTTLRAVTYATGFDPSPIVSADFNIVAELSNGLRGRYYDSQDFNGLVATRTDPTIDFEYGDGAPPFEDQGGSYSILWTGQVTPLYTETYTFTTINDDGVRLWVDDQLVIDDWNFHGPEERSGTVQLTANQPVSIWLEYFNGGGGGTIQLMWENPQSPQEIIPDSAMVPNLPAGQQPVVSLLFNGEESYPETFSEPITFELRRRGNLDDAFPTLVSFSGTATRLEDYQAGLNLRFEAGQASVTGEITITNDDLVEEPEETVIITLEPSPNYQTSEPTVQQFVIADDDVEVDSISGTITYTGTESGSIVVEAFRETDPVFAKRRVTLANPGAYTISNLEEGEYTVIAYIDADDDEQLDDGETWGIYQGGGTAPVLVAIPPGQTGIDINLDVAPGEVPNEEDEGCCATIASRNDGTSGWLALALGAVVLGLRRRRIH